MELRAGGALSLAPEPREEGEYTNVSVCTNTEIAQGGLADYSPWARCDYRNATSLDWFGGTAGPAPARRRAFLETRVLIRGTDESIAERGCSRSRAALRLMRPRP